MGSPAAASAYAGSEGAQAHGEGEAFPRIAVSHLVGENLEESRRRSAWQDWAVTFGLLCLALAAPTTRLLGDGPGLVHATQRGDWISYHVVLMPLSRVLELIPGVGAERGWYLIAAACWAGSYLVLSRMAVAIGLSRLASSLAALLVLFSPLGFLAGTQPGPGSAALLGSAMLFSTLLRASGPAPLGTRARELLWVWGGVCLLHPALALLLPAVIWKLLVADDGRVASGADSIRVVSTGLLAVGLLIGLFLAVAFGMHSVFDVGLTARELGLLMLGKGGVGAPDSMTWLFVLIPCIGVGLLGIVEVLRRPAERTESGPPAWILAFVGVPLAVRLLGGTPSLETGAWVLGPMLALGLAGYFERTLDGRHWLTIVALGGIQLALIGGFRGTMTLGDPNRGWTKVASEVLNPGDLVLTRDLEHDYLLRHRFGVETVNLRAPIKLSEAERPNWWADAREVVQEQVRSGGRVVVDWKSHEPPGGARGYMFKAQLHELVLLAPVVHLEHTEPEKQVKDPFEADEL